MRDLAINQVDMYYALYVDNVPILDADGNETGEYTSGYEKPVHTKARISANKGNSKVEAFGITTDYDRTISTVKKLPMDETSILWVDTMPVLEADGTTKTPNDYTVKKRAPDLNQNLWAIKKVVK